MEPRPRRCHETPAQEPRQPSSGTGSPAPFGPRYPERFRVGSSRSRTRAQPRESNRYLVIIARQQPPQRRAYSEYRKVCTGNEFRGTRLRGSTRRKIDRCRSTAENAVEESLLLLEIAADR